MIQHLMPFLKNVKAGPKTTIMGGFLILASILLMFVAKETIVQVLNTGVLSVGIVLLFLKDFKETT